MCVCVCVFYIFSTICSDGDTFTTSVLLYHHPKDGLITGRNIVVKMLQKPKYVTNVQRTPLLSVHCTELPYFVCQTAQLQLFMWPRATYWPALVCDFW